MLIEQDLVMDAEIVIYLLILQCQWGLEMPLHCFDGNHLCLNANGVEDYLSSLSVV